MFQTFATKRRYAWPANLEWEIIKKMWISNLVCQVSKRFAFVDVHETTARVERWFRRDIFGSVVDFSCNEKQLAMDPVKIEYNLEKFTAWIEDQPDLPQNLDKLLLIRYLKASDFSLERAKFLLRNSLKWRKSYPHIFTQRDPLSDEIQKVVEYAWVQQKNM